MEARKGKQGTLTRGEFLKAAGAGTAGLALLGTSAASSGCASYLPTGGFRMNIVVVILDSLRKDHVGAYGNGRIQTPNLDALAKDSLRFERAYPESLPTVCARRAIHTGLRTFPFRDWDPVPSDLVRLEGWQPIPEKQTTLAEIVRNEGFETMLVSDVPHQFKPFYNFHRGFNVFHWVRGQERDFYRPGWMCPQDELDRSLFGGFNSSHMEDVMRQHLANTRGSNSEESQFSPQVFERATELLEGVSRGGQPFFMMVDNYDPHEPWNPPEEYISLYDEGYEGPEPRTAPNGDAGWYTGRQLERMRALYSAEVTMTDHSLGRLLDKMEELKLMDNTLLMVLSDHGFLLGEHGLAGKLPSGMYPEIMDITYFIRHPEGKGAGQTSDFYASTHDVAPTILGAMNIEPPSPMDGQDLGGILDGDDPEPRDHFTAGYGDRVWAQDDRYAMSSLNDGSDARLHDLESDPEMNKDVAAEHPDIVKRMFREYVLKDAGGPLPKY